MAMGEGAWAPPPHQPQGVRLGLSSVTSECPAREEMVLTVTH